MGSISFLSWVLFPYALQVAYDLTYCELDLFGYDMESSEMFSLVFEFFHCHYVCEICSHFCVPLSKCMIHFHVSVEEHLIFKGLLIYG